MSGGQPAALSPLLSSPLSSRYLSPCLTHRHLMSQSALQSQVLYLAACFAISFLPRAYCRPTRTEGGQGWKGRAGSLAALTRVHLYS